MFVLLEHRTDSGIHWDLMIEMPGRERLATWRMAENPVERPEGAVAAEPIGDHRRIYLEYEGELSDGRGRVARIDHGKSQIVDESAARLVVKLDGRRLCGQFEVENGNSGPSTFRRV